MGRLDDIVARNKRALRGDGLIVKAIDKVGGGAPLPPAGDAETFTLASQRRSGTAAWKVILLMVVLGSVIGLYSCNERKLESDRQHELEGR